MKHTLTIFVCVVYLGMILSKDLDSNEPISPNLKFVATVDGKSYFAEPTAMSWVGAGNYCTSLGMQLASISSQRQADVLNSSYHVPDFNGHYWTSGRDSYLPRQFTSNTTQEPMSEVYLELRLSSTVYRTCISYYSAPETSALYTSVCSAHWKVLCETIS